MKIRIKCQLQIDDLFVWEDFDGEWWVRCPHKDIGFCWRCECGENKLKAFWGKAKLKELEYR